MKKSILITLLYLFISTYTYAQSEVPSSYELIYATTTDTLYRIEDTTQCDYSIFFFSNANKERYKYIIVPKNEMYFKKLLSDIYLSFEILNKVCNNVNEYFLDMPQGDNKIFIFTKIYN